MLENTRQTQLLVDLIYFVVARHMNESRTTKDSRGEILCGSNIRIKLRNDFYKGSIAQDLRGQSIYNVGCIEDGFPPI